MIESRGLRRIVGCLLALCVACGGETTTKQEPPPPVSSVTIGAVPASMVVGAQAQLSVRLLSATGVELTGRQVAWGATGGVVTVSADGVLNAVQPGVGIVTATCEGRVATVSVRVTPKPIAQITVTPAERQLIIGSTFTPTAVALDDSAQALSGRSFTWTSDNTTVASVTSFGTVIAIAQGTARVSASAEGKSGSVLVRVIPIPVASLTLAPTSLTLSVRQSGSLVATPRDSVGRLVAGRTITWASSAPNVATVNTSGFVTAVALGNAIITASVEGVTAVANVTVQPPPVATLVITPSTSRIPVGASVSLSATARDASGAVLTDRPLSWASDNPSVATVSSSGVVSAIANGVTTIRATVEGRSASASVQVVVPNLLVQISPSSGSVLLGQNLQLQASVRDSSTGVLFTRGIEWRSRTPSVATVTSTGLVTGWSFGTAIIEALSEGKVGQASIRIDPRGPVVVPVLGDGQTAPTRGIVPISPTVVVRDDSGRPVPGLVVTFEVVENTGSVVGGIDTTDAEGAASAASWTLGILSGSNKLRATVGLPAVRGNPVVFTATGTLNGTGPIGSCCRRCTTGKPCGDSCIAVTSTCRTIGGCACYGASTWNETILRVATKTIREAPWRVESTPQVSTGFFPFSALWSFGCFDSAMIGSVS